MDNDGLILRELVPSDLAYIFATGLRTWRDSDSSPFPDDIWYAAARQLLERLLSSPDFSVKLLVAEDAPNEIIGYIIAEESKALWLMYVRKSYQRFQLHQRLLQAANLTETSPSAWRGQLAQNPLRSRQLRKSVAQ